MLAIEVADIGDEGDKQGKGVPLFVTKLLAMLSDTTVNHMIAWSEVRCVLIFFEESF